VDKCWLVGKKKVLIRTKTEDIRLAKPEIKRTSKHRSAKRRPSSRDEVHNRLDRLAVALSEVRGGARISPRTSKLFASGPPKMAQKLIEEAAEAAIEAIRGDRMALINESVDLLYNLSALWTELGVSTDEIWSEMDRREAALGMAEKLPKSALEEG
jgi:phosphoribosyl-ATP pyrophosphohydrolase